MTEPTSPFEHVHIVVPEGQEEAVATILAGHIEEIPNAWGCPECGSQEVTVEAIQGQFYDVPIKALWASATHGHRAHLDWTEVHSGENKGVSTTVFGRLRCQVCGWRKQTNGDTEVLRRA